jgi:hypothetical protein
MPHPLQLSTRRSQIDRIHHALAVCRSLGSQNDKLLLLLCGQFFEEQLLTRSKALVD